MSSAFTLTVNSSWPDEIDTATSLLLDKLALDIESDAQRFAAVDTGLMRSRIYYEVNDLSLRVGVRNVEYWMTVEFGSSPHVITPRNAKALYWPGARHPVARVNHPGTPAQPFLRPALYRRREAL
ncbi:HK97 gp10 family phage protein [Streptomyces sp. NPDC060027]|uniref:HK97 gp10 family phage protein n=1 Tax=Streptomyces sp. NPDC060027 TaxID=3347040 RepID=UPI0036B86543